MKNLLLLAFFCFSAFPADTRHFELRIYENYRGKLDGTLERFRSDIVRLFEKHGLAPLGFWTTKADNRSDVMVYLLAAPSKESFDQSTQSFSNDPEFKAAFAASTEKHGNTVKKIDSLAMKATDWSPLFSPERKFPTRTFELRIYDVKSGRMDGYLASYRDHRLALFEKHGLESLGFWTVNDQDKFVMLIAHENEAAIKEAKDAYHADPDWSRATKPLEKGGTPTGSVTTYILIPTDFSKTK
jgi:hypothetical protein